MRKKRKSIYANSLTELRKKERKSIRDLEDDLDFEKRHISINHNAVYHVIEDEEGNRHSEMHINTPKTEAGNRIIPMIDEVYEAFLEEYEIQSCLVSKIQEIMGHSDISTTMDIYAEATDEKKKEILTDLQGKIMVI